MTRRAIADPRRVLVKNLELTLSNRRQAAESGPDLPPTYARQGRQPCRAPARYVRQPRLQAFRRRRWTIWTHLARHLLPQMLPEGISDRGASRSSSDRRAGGGTYRARAWRSNGDESSTSALVVEDRGEWEVVGCSLQRLSVEGAGAAAGGGDAVRVVDVDARGVESQSGLFGQAARHC